MAESLPNHMFADQDLWAVVLGFQESQVYDFPHTQIPHQSLQQQELQQQQQHNPQPQVSEPLLLSSQAAQDYSAHNPEEKKMKQRSQVVAFKTRSQTTQLDDGFKWRKYGRKVLKRNNNPRNYYKCSVSSCCAKKKVEIDPEDKGVVITTYEGAHNHESPSASAVYYITEPLLLPTPGSKPALMIVNQGN